MGTVQEALDKLNNEINDYRAIIQEANARIDALVAAKDILATVKEDNISKLSGNTWTGRANTWGRNIINTTVRNIIRSMHGEIAVAAVTDKCSKLLKGQVSSGSVSSVMRKMVKEGRLARIRRGVYTHAVRLPSVITVAKKSI